MPLSPREQQPLYGAAEMHDDDSMTTLVRVRDGYAPFLTERIAQRVAALHHGESVTIKIIRGGNAPVDDREPPVDD